MKSKKSKKNNPPRELSDLVSVGPATLKDFEMLGIESLQELAKCDAKDLYHQISALSGVQHDPCVEDVFRAAIEQAKNPSLPAEQKQWFYWSRVRKGVS